MPSQMIAVRHLVKGELVRSHGNRKAKLPKGTVYKVERDAAEDTRAVLVRDVKTGKLRSLDRDQRVFQV
jgi:hypothetical protein